MSSSAQIINTSPDFEAAKELLQYASYFIPRCTVLRNRLEAHELTPAQGRHQWHQMVTKVEPPHIWQALDERLYYRVRNQAANVTNPIERRFWQEVKGTL